MGTAYLAIIVLTGYYFLAFDPRKNPYDTTSTKERASNSATHPDNATSSSSPADNADHTADLEDTVPASKSAPSRHKKRSEWAPNPVDQFFLENRFALWLLPRRETSSESYQLYSEVEKTFNKVSLDYFIWAQSMKLTNRKYMLATCDIQMVTGLSILISAFATLPGPTGISAYHWHIVVYLAWFSNLTHMLGLTSLRKHLHQKASQPNWRLVPMTILFVLLMIALFPTAYFDWIDDPPGEFAKPESFARCFWDARVIVQRGQNPDATENFPAKSGSTMILSAVVLAATYFVRIIKLSKRVAAFMRQTARRRARNAAICLVSFSATRLPTQSPRTETLRQLLIVQPMAAAILTARIYTDFYLSTFSEIWWAWAAAAWVTIRILQTRMSGNVDESEMSFGQIMAILLLVVPTIGAGITLRRLIAKWLEQQDSSRSVDFARVDDAPHETEQQLSTSRSSADTSRNPNSFSTSGTDLILNLVDDSSQSYALPSSSAAIMLMWIQIILTSLAYLLTTGGVSQYAIRSPVLYGPYGAISLGLQPLNCSLLILLGIRWRMQPQASGEHYRATRSLRRFSSRILNYQDGILIWSLLGLVFIAALVFASPFHQVLMSYSLFGPAIFLGPWLLYYIYAFLEALISPSQIAAAGNESKLSVRRPQVV